MHTLGGGGEQAGEGRGPRRCGEVERICSEDDAHRTIHQGIRQMEPLPSGPGTPRDGEGGVLPESSIPSFLRSFTAQIFIECSWGAGH